MELIVVGLSHKSAPVELRERVAPPLAQLPDRLGELLGLEAIRETALLSTCNRVEIYAAVEDADRALPSVRGAIRQWAGTDMSKHLYELAGVEAVKHIFRVASSLDSMVVGEPQILGQVKDAYSHATDAHTTGPILNRCFHRAFQVAKRVRSETGVARAAVSMSAIAVELAKTIFEALEDRRVLLLGAGEMAELAARHLAGAGVAEIIVANRSLDRAQRIAHDVGGRAHSIAERSTLMEIADIVITSTAATTFLLGPKEARRIMRARKYRPLFIIDLAVPRDIDPRVGDLDNVYLYDVDDLQRVADRNRSERSREAGEAEAIVETESVQFLTWVRSLEVVPTIVALRERFVEVAHMEAERTLGQLGPPDEEKREMARRMAEAITNKLLHLPLTQLKDEGRNGGLEMVATVQRLFGLQVGTGSEEPGTAADAASSGPQTTSTETETEERKA